MIHVGDVRAVLPTLPAESVHCVVSSPPFYQLRDYGVDGQIGLEDSPDAYIEQLTAVFREVRRVLRSDGVAFVEIGDSYASSSTYNAPQSLHTANGWKQAGRSPNGRKPDGYKPKDLMLIPFRLAAALQADGWWLRQIIVWSRPNPMPESIQGSHFARHRIADPDAPPGTALPLPLVDCPGCPKCAANDGYVLHMSAGRCTTSHSYVLLLAKSARYFFDSESIREKAEYGFSVDTGNAWQRVGDTASPPARGGGRVIPGNGGTRNKRSVWEIPTYPLKDAHFATFPPKLVEPCVLAGTSERGCCRVCGAPHVRVVDKEYLSPILTTGTEEGRHTKGRSRNVTRMGDGVNVTTTGWRASCTCPDAGEPVPCTVLDPFGGSGTVGQVCERLGRKWILVELSPAYAELARKRTAQRGLFGWDGAGSEVAG